MLIGPHLLGDKRPSLKDCSGWGKLSFWIIWLYGCTTPLIGMVSFALQPPSASVIDRTFQWMFGSCAILSFFGLLFGIAAICLRRDRSIITLFSTAFNLLTFPVCSLVTFAVPYMHQGTA